MPCSCVGSSATPYRIVGVLAAAARRASVGAQAGDALCPSHPCCYSRPTSRPTSHPSLLPPAALCLQMPDGCSTVNKDGSCRACFDGYKMVSGKCLRCRDSACIACDSDACERTARSHCGADGFCSNCTELWPGISASCRWW